MSLTDQQLEGFRQRLLQLQQELAALQQTGAEAARVVELDQTSVGRLSRMDALQGQAMSQEQGRRRVIEQQKISAALRRLEAGDYGYCAAPRTGPRSDVVHRLREPAGECLARDSG